MRERNSSSRTWEALIPYTVKQLTESAEPPATEIKEFTNTAIASLSYPKWGADGSGPVLTEKHDDDDAVVEVKSLELPIVSVDKTSNIADGSAAEVGEQHPIEYTLKITNTRREPAVDFIDPVLVDILPTGVKLKRDDTHKVILNTDGAPNSNITLAPADVVPIEGKMIQHVTLEDGSDYSDAETAVIFKLKGHLKPGEFVTVTFTAVAQPSALLYEVDNTAPIVRNDVYLSSAVHTYHTTNNPNGYSA